MQLSCPSCGVQHKTEDYPQAFEINCVCGYSILVPDEAAILKSSEETRFDSAVPTSMEEEDKGISFKLPEDRVESGAVENVEAQGVLSMTPPDQLPKGMVYDPFELPQIPLPPSDAASVGENPPSGEGLSVDASVETDERGPLADASSEVTSDSLDENAPLSPQPVLQQAPQSHPPPASLAQTIVERSQLASMGQLLGRSYRLECLDLDREALTVIKNRCQKILHERPWLESETRRRGLNFEELADTPSINDVPEILAVEIYLACFEMGGRCRFEPMA